MYKSDSQDHRWGVILAGGDGKSPMVSKQRTLLVMTRSHEAFYLDQVEGLPSSGMAVQPHNQGTAPAILYSLLRLREMDRPGIVAFFPSDHHFSDDEAFARHLEFAYAAAASLPERVILQGIPPDTPEVEYGWIEPGVSADHMMPGSVFPVGRFWEKPHRKLAAALTTGGCLWKSFIMVGNLGAFLNLIRRTLPGLLDAFESVGSSLLTPSGETEVSRLYSRIQAADFSEDVLSVRPNDLAVLLATGLGCSDLGDPGRVLSVLGRKGVDTESRFGLSQQFRAARAG
jgi:mannose-1-phosphate guanylyltransferase